MIAAKKGSFAMNSCFARLAVATILFSLTTIRCTSSGVLPTEPSLKLVTQTMKAAASLIAVIHQTPPTETFPTPRVITPEPSATPEDTPPPVIIHFTQPGEPPLHTSSLSDLSSAILADQKRTIGDHFDLNLYERPLSPRNMIYKDFLDIAPGAELSLAPPWVYVTIFLVGAPPQYAKATYAVELDLNLDARGDWLITASSPASTEWTTDGVRAYFDTNRNVGGKTPMIADPLPQTGDGYDALIFDQGRGPDPDAAWVRISPSKASAIQIAFKHTLIGQDQTLIWGVWADGGVNRPQWFDYNDHFTVSEAGLPIPSSRYYPLQRLALIDNTCRWVQGIVPRVGMPGLCGFNTPIPTITPIPEATSTPP